MFLQSRESPERYVLDRLPPWVEDMLGQARERSTDVRAVAGANLELCNQESRAVLYRALLEGGYKVRQLSGRA
jgi:hypothetical protein